MTMPGAWPARTVGRSPSWTAAAQRSIRWRICCSSVMSVPSSWTDLTGVEPGPARTFIALGKIDP